MCSLDSPRFVSLTLLLFSLFVRMGIQAQVATGTWQDQMNLSRCVDVAVSVELGLALVAVETGVFAMTLDGQGQPTGEIQRFGKAQGLSRADVSRVALSHDPAYAIVSFSQGTFDLIRIDVDGTLTDVVPVNDLADAGLVGNKEPHRLVVEGHRLLVCTDLGVIEYDLEAVEVRDTWKLQSGEMDLSIRSVGLRGERWWVATQSGLWSAPVGSAFPGNPATWTLSGLDGADLVDLVVTGAGDLLSIEQREGPDAVWRLGEAGSVEEVSVGFEEEWVRLAVDGNHVWASTSFGVVQWNPDGSAGPLRVQVGNVFLQPRGLAGHPGGLWLANAHSGVLRIDQDGEAFVGPFAPNGPRSNDCVRMDAWNDRLWLAAGGIDGAGVPLYRQEGFSGRKGSWWRTIAPPDGEAGGAGVQDVMDVSIHPLTPELATFGSLEEGLVDIRETEVEAYWNPSNSPLDWNANWQEPRCAVPALDYDRLGNLWLINEGTETPLHLRDAEGGWHVFELEGLDASTRFWKLLATQADQVWMVLGSGEGVAVLSTGGTPSDPSDDDFRILGQGDGGLPSGFVYAVEEDLDGEIWLGTLQGPAVFYQPSGLFGPDPIDAQQILIEQDGNYQLLLETEIVQDIALDGGNRKWLATINSGVFLVSPDGREQVAHFTAENSPLPTDEVYDITIDQSNGTVYFATPNGLTSFSGTATNFVSELGGEDLSVFPNPWRPEYPPTVTIDGLAFGSEVHIVDAAGRRVRRLDSAGGRAVWDTYDDEGRPVPEGVYFALAGEAVGKSGGSGKMVILR